MIRMTRGFKVALFCLIISVSGIFFGYFGVDKVMATGQSRLQKLELFSKVLFLIESQYYREVDASILIQGAIKGMMETLDPHSAYLDEEIFNKLNEETKGEFGGLGIEVSYKDGVLYVITPIEDSPAFKAGIKPKDKIVEIDYESTLGMTLNEAVDKMKGPINSEVTLGINRNDSNEVVRYKLTRKTIKIKSTKSQLVSENYAYIRLIQFQKDCANAVAEALKSIKKNAKQGLKGIILDLRSNPGGLLEEAVDLSSIFLKSGIVVSTEGRDPKNKEIKYVKKTGYKETELPIVVLINGASASASEIVAGALKDHKRAIIMGSQSFGKGSVQTIAKIDKDRGVKLTVAQYMTPSGKKIQAIGIAPDVDLADFDKDWITKHKRTSQYLREKDLTNHLTATIETPEEKKAREISEKQERKVRAQAILERKKSANKKEEEEDEVPREYNPDEDYEVMQAVQYLKTFKLLKDINTQA